MLPSFSLKKPDISKDLAINLAEEHFGLKSKILKVKEFDSYCDQNFYFETKSDQDQDNEFVLKILNHADAAVEGMVEAQNETMLFLKNKGLACPVPMLSSSGSYLLFRDCDKPEKIQVTRDKGSRVNVVRMMRYIPGEILKNLSVITEDLLFDLGQYVGKMDKILKDFSHPGLSDQVQYTWDLLHLGKIKPYIKAQYLGSQDSENLIMNVYNQYFATVPQVLQKCTKQVIHNDVNECNIVLTQDPSDTADTKWSIAGVIDFGDVCYSYRVFEVAIAMSGIIAANYSAGNPRTFESAGRILRGYQSIYPLSPEELAIVYWCIAGRYIQLVTIGSFRSSFEPENKYITDMDTPVWKVLPEYLKISPEDMLDKWMNEDN